MRSMYVGTLRPAAASTTAMDFDCRATPLLCADLATGGSPSGRITRPARRVLWNSAFLEVKMRVEWRVPAGVHHTFMDCGQPLPPDGSSSSSTP